jgi:hypothetical protein
LSRESEWYANEEFWEWSFSFMFPVRRIEQATEAFSSWIMRGAMRLGSDLLRSTHDGRPHPGN